METMNQKEIEQAKAAAAAFDDDQDAAEERKAAEKLEASLEASKDAKLSAAEYTKAYLLRELIKWFDGERDRDEMEAQKALKELTHELLFVLPNEKTAREWCDRKAGVFAVSYLDAAGLADSNLAYVVFDDKTDAAGLVIKAIKKAGAIYTQLDAGELATEDHAMLIERGRADIGIFRAERDRHNFSLDDIVESIKEYNEQKPLVTKTFGANVRFKPSAMSVIVARSNRGKSKALKSIAVEALMAGRHVVFFTLEELPRQIFEDMVLSFYYEGLVKYGNIKNTRLETVYTLRDYIAGKGAASEWMIESIGYVSQCMKEHALHIVDSRNTGEIGQFVKSLCKTGDVVIIDYLQLATLGQVFTDKFLRVETVAQELCAIAKETGVMLITAAQANREGAKGDGGRVKGIKHDSLEPENIRDSDAILHESDIVIGLGAEDSNGEAELCDGSMKRDFFKVLKNRQEPVDYEMRGLVFQGAYSYLRAKLRDDGKLDSFEFTNTKQTKDD